MMRLSWAGMQRRLNVTVISVRVLMVLTCGCDGGGGSEDAGDARDFDASDEALAEGDGPADPDAVEGPDGAEDPAGADADGDAGEDEGGGGSGTCADPFVLACGDSLASETTAGAGSSMAGYVCGEFGVDETGPERVYRIEPPAPKWVTVTVTPGGIVDLDLFVLGGTCASDACFRFSAGTGTEAAAFSAGAGAPAFVVVDGYNGAEGAFSLVVECGEPEECGNHADDNGNGLTDGHAKGHSHGDLYKTRTYHLGFAWCYRGKSYCGFS